MGAADSFHQYKSAQPVSAQYPCAVAQTAAEVKKALRKLANADDAANLSWFFKTGPGDYGEGDLFLGIKVPKIRSVTKEFAGLSEAQIRILSRSKFHEDRFCALAILTNRFKKSTDLSERAHLWDFYLELVDAGAVNNWDLVDSTAPYLGQHLIKKRKPMPIIMRLVRHEDLWHQRVGVLVTAAFIDNGDFEPTLKVSKEMLDHKHDLMHKACGWMLREVGKKDIQVLRSFLNENSQKMPRTMLRYSIEKMVPEERQHWLRR